MNQNTTRKIFLVDDDHYSLGIYEQQLRNMGFQSITSFSTAKGLLENLDQAPDLIFLDYYLGDDNGCDVLKKIKDQKPCIDVVMMSGQTDMKTTVNLLNNGAFDYIIKEYQETGKIISVVNKWLLAREQRILANLSCNDHHLLKLIAEAKESVRKEIAHELHDNITQLLASSKLFIETAKRDLHGNTALLDEGCVYINQAICETRNLSHSLSGLLLKNTNLEEDIQHIIAGFRWLSHLELTTNINLEGKEHLLGNEIKHNLLRIIQEQLNNTMKYANANSFTIRIHVKADKLSVQVKDNGNGFDTKTINKGLGLNSIKSRVTKLRGVAKLISSPGKGCRWDITIPLLAGQVETGKERGV